jgi:alkylated DNA nucleotide flippase Atl1
MDIAQLRAVVEAIPPGRWMSYADVVRAAGGSPRQAIGVNARLVRAAAGGEPVAGAHRVLKSDGSVAAGALGDPAAVHAALAADGVPLEDPDRGAGGRAAQSARLRPPVAEEEPAAERPASARPWRRKSRRRSGPAAERPGGRAARRRSGPGG